MHHISYIIQNALYNDLIDWRGLWLWVAVVGCPDGYCRRWPLGSIHDPIGQRIRASHLLCSPVSITTCAQRELLRVIIEFATALGPKVVIAMCVGGKRVKYENMFEYTFTDQVIAQNLS